MREWENVILNELDFVIESEIMPNDTIYYLIDDKIIYGVSESTGDDCLLLPIKTF